MSKIREIPVSNCEKQFLIKCLSEDYRLDGRAFEEFRELTIEFGKDWGCCNVTLGKTRVLAQVSCEIQQPKSSRPSEGILNVNVELNPMAAPHFEAGRQSDLSVQLNRLLEKCLKDSKAVDLESLCIKMNEKVWALRVDLNVLNHEGNILDCASVAALSSLAHFRRPDVTCEGEHFVIHSFKQRDPIPIVIHHRPVCVTYAIFDGDLALADPNLLEEGVAEAHLTVGLNAHKELCVLHLGGKAALNPEQILKLTTNAANRASFVIGQIKNSLETDKMNRDNNLTGFQNFQEGNKDHFIDLQQCFDQFQTNTQTKKNTKKRKLEKDNFKVDTLGEQSAVLVPVTNNQNVWTLDSDDDVMFVDNTEKVEILDSD